MWKTFQHNDQLYMIKSILKEDGTCVLYLTDLTNIWVQSLSKDSLLQQFRETNPLLEIKIEDAVTEVIALVEHIPDIENLDMSKSEEELQLGVKYLKSEFKMQFKFIFTKASSEVFLREVTVPLIQTVKHLEERQIMLSNLVLKKDRELEEYKLEKGLISRDDLITEKFDESKLGDIDDKSMMNVFGRSKQFWEGFVQKYGNIESKIEDVKQDPWNHMKRKRVVYSSKTVSKKGKGINYSGSK